MSTLEYSHPKTFGLEMVFVLAFAVSFVTSIKCRTSVDVGIKWTVDCSAMNLSAAPSPLNLHPVLSLLLSHNEFVHLTEFEFCNWTDISHLDMSYNKIKTVGESSFKGLSGLSELNLMYNEIEVLSTNITKYLPKLKILNMSSNKLKQLSQGSFEYIPMLLKLYLGNNFHLGKTSLDSFINLGSVPSLVSLDISNTSLSTVSHSFLGSASRLIALNIAYNPLASVPNIFFSLRSLNISGTLLETLHSGILSNSDSLRKLTMENMPLLKDIQSNALSGLIGLEELYINNCSKLGFISGEIFGETQPKLKRIVISNCALTTLSENLRELFINTEDINLQGTSWLCDGRISWIANLNVQPNHTLNLRLIVMKRTPQRLYICVWGCAGPPAARGILLMDYFKPRNPHSQSTLIRAGIIVALVAVLVASVIGIIRQSKKEKPETYRQLQDISLQDRITQQQP